MFNVLEVFGGRVDKADTEEIAKTVATTTSLTQEIERRNSGAAKRTAALHASVVQLLWLPVAGRMLEWHMRASTIGNLDADRRDQRVFCLKALDSVLDLHFANYIQRNLTL